MKDKIERIAEFIMEETTFFEETVRNLDKESYIANPILRRAVDKSINDIILALVDISMNLLRVKKRTLPKTYKQIILSTFEFVGDVVYKVAPLVKCRNETIHNYMNINWENVKTIKNSLNEIRQFVEKVRTLVN